MCCPIKSLINVFIYISIYILLTNFYCYSIHTNPFVHLNLSKFKICHHTHRDQFGASQNFVLMSWAQDYRYRPKWCEFAQFSLKKKNSFLSSRKLCFKRPKTTLLISRKIFYLQIFRLNFLIKWIQIHWVRLKWRIK